MKYVTVDEPFQRNYVYLLEAAEGADFDESFKPDLTPSEMLQLGIFGGDYFQRVPREFPAGWFRGVKLSNTGSADKSLNYFKVNASQPLAEWQRKGWISPEDPKGWFLWYCRYYLGRRSDDDDRQIKRWRNMRRHVSQLQNSCHHGDESCHPRQRQALLHWAYDSRKL